MTPICVRDEGVGEPANHLTLIRNATPISIKSAQRPFRRLGRLTDKVSPASSGIGYTRDQMTFSQSQECSPFGTARSLTEGPDAVSGIVAALGAGLAIAWFDLFAALVTLDGGLGRNVISLALPVALAAVTLSLALLVCVPVPKLRLVTPVGLCVMFLLAIIGGVEASFAYPDRMKDVVHLPEPFFAVMAAILIGCIAAWLASTALRRGLVDIAAQRRFWSILPGQLMLATAFVWLIRRSWASASQVLVGGCAAAATTAVLWWVWRSDRGARLATACLSMAWLVTILLAGVTSFGGSGAERNVEGQPAEKAPATVVLITVDTLRADAVDGVATYPPTPSFDRIASSGVVFSNAIAPSPWTFPSLASIVTGLSPMVHQINGYGDALPDQVATVAGTLAQQGYRTALIGRSPFFRPDYNLHKGFAERQVFPTMWPAQGFATILADRLVPRLDAGTSALAERACSWLREQGDAPVFLWLHLYDPHRPYDPPERFQPSGKPARRIGSSFSRFKEIRIGTWVPTAKEQRWIRQLYFGEVRLVDEAVGQVVDTLETLERLEDALVIVSSDHGEEFWEHGDYEHGHTLYQEVIAVPLIIRGPGLGIRPGVVADPVTITAIAPTILDLCGVPVNPRNLSAGSLVNSWADPGSWSPDLVTSRSLLYYSQRETVIDGRYKLIRDIDGNRAEIFDLEADPAERMPARVLDSAAAERLSNLLDQEAALALRLRQYHGLEDTDPQIRDPDERRRLEALGYVAP